ncbi:DUF2189 domain-containing protein [Thalassobaculum litoreum]|uniref:Uncharacterized membrane protein n=1 Tax=Thalassobaculum litoreum DSM 18839 TaxID=1123362 RepID=A0A8G2EWG5_9PROT|nr:DUF2189 domain-containing protein [Thalassobaculum litoreum]SDF78708.1 Uncharacterized membrane protein [Thalassobaculum litoreum DSM 18839]
MSTDQPHTHTSPVPRLDVRAAGFDDIRAALGAGLRDTVASPVLSLFFGLVCALFGAVLVSSLVVYDQILIAVAAGVGFPLVAPFLAAGLYEISRRRSRGESYRASDIFLVVFAQRGRQLGWMSFVVLFVFWMWAYQVRLVMALTLGYRGMSSLEAFADVLLTTSQGASFLIVGTIVGAVLSTILYSLTVISMPLLLDKEIDFITAMITSVKTVLASPAVMLIWGAAVGALTLLAIAPALLGVIVIFPILGHTTWHLYDRLVFEK